MGISYMRSKGQLTLPQEVRSAAHLDEGDPVQIEVADDGSILLRPMKMIDASQAWFWTESWQAGEVAATADIAAGRTTVHETTDDFLTALAD